jgi:magnesium transporter
MTIRTAQRKRKTGLPPGALVFTGKQKVESPNLSLMQYGPESEVLEQEAQDQIPAAAAGLPVSWYDMRGLHKVEFIQELGERFGAHALVLEDVLNTQQRPKFEEHERAFFITIQALSFDAASLSVQTEQVAIYAGEGFLLSFQEDETDLFASVRARLRNGRGRIRSRGTDYLAYALLDNIVDHYYLVLDQMEEALAKLEEDILGASRQESKRKIHELKMQFILLRKTIAPLREAISRFSRSESALIARGTGIFLRDLHDHVIQITDTIDTLRDVINGLYDLYLSEINLRMNNVIQVLTIISTIFIPLTFLAGVYGMNFDNMPELHWKYGYFIIWGVMLCIALSLLLVFKHKKWL